MKYIYHLLLLFITFIFFQSCEKEIEFDSKLIAPKMVINGFIQQDSLISIIIWTSKAIPGVEKPNVWIYDATVKLFVNGEEKEILSSYNIDNYLFYNPYSSQPTGDSIQFIKGYRSQTTKAEAGKIYKLVVSHPNYETVTCETSIPIPVKIDNIDTITKIEVSNGYSSSTFQIKIKFKDVAGEKNYYRLVYKSLTGIANPNNYYKGDTTYSIYVYEELVGTYINSDDPIINPSGEDANDLLFGSPSNSFNLFNDDFIEGKEYEMSFNLNSNYYNNSNVLNTSIGEFLRLSVELQSITREAYLYMKSVGAYNYYNSDFLSEPVQVYTNIENGIGVFAGYSSYTKSISKGEYPMKDIEYQVINNGYYSYISY